MYPFSFHNVYAKHLDHFFVMDLSLNFGTVYVVHLSLIIIMLIRVMTVFMKVMCADTLHVPYLKYHSLKVSS